MNNLAHMYLEGIGVEKNEKDAHKWYQKAAAANDPDAMKKLGWMYEKGLGGLQKDENEAQKWYRKAAQSQ
jgi:TPR repeat protein